MFVLRNPDPLVRQVSGMEVGDPCGVIDCGEASVEIATMTADAGLVARFPLCLEHRDYAVREGIAQRRWVLEVSPDRYMVERQR